MTIVGVISGKVSTHSCPDILERIQKCRLVETTSPGFPFRYLTLPGPTGVNSPTTAVHLSMHLTVCVMQRNTESRRMLPAEQKMLASLPTVKVCWKRRENKYRTKKMTDAKGTWQLPVWGICKETPPLQHIRVNFRRTSYYKIIYYKPKVIFHNIYTLTNNRGVCIVWKHITYM